MLAWAAQLHERLSQFAIFSELCIYFFKTKLKHDVIFLSVSSLAAPMHKVCTWNDFVLPYHACNKTSTLNRCWKRQKCAWHWWATLHVSSYGIFKLVYFLVFIYFFLRFFYTLCAYFVALKVQSFNIIPYVNPYYWSTVPLERSRGGEISIW